MTISSWRHKILKSLSFEKKDKMSILINKGDDLEKVACVLKEVCAFGNTNFRLTSFDIELPEYFRDLNIEIDYSWDYLNEEDCMYVDEFFFRKLARSWFLFKTFPQDYINEYTKILLGNCCEYDFIISNFMLIKYIEVINNILINYKPTKILIIEDRPYLVNIVKLFKDRYNFKFLRINPESKSILNRLRTLSKTIKVILVDSAILLLDFFVLHCVFMFKKFENKIIIDYRLYKKFAQTKLKEELLICPFEKGLKIRLEMLFKGLSYLPLSSPSCFDFFLLGKESFKWRYNWSKLQAESYIKGGFVYRDLIFWDAVEKYLLKVFLVVAPRVMSNLNRFEKFARKKKLKLIVMRNDSKELERTLIEVGQQLNIPTLVIQHGILGDINMSTALHADMTAVWGKASIDWFKQFGYPNNRFTVTGNPMYDELCHRLSSNHQDSMRKKVCQELHLSSQKKIITFLTSSFSNQLFCSCFLKGNMMFLMLRAILEAIQSLPENQLIVKVHPYDENLQIYSKIIKNFNLNSKAVVLRDFNIFDILEASDLVITLDSSSGLEALILDKPLIVLKMNRIATTIPYVEKGVAIKASKADEVNSAIENSLYNEKVREGLRLKRKEFVFDYAYNIEGQATKRVEELMYKLISDVKENA